MRLLHILGSFCRNLTGKRRVERELSDEVSSFVELSTRAKVREGMDECDARRAALLELEGTEQIKERMREMRSGYRFETFLRDLRFALRTLRKAPAFSFTVVAVLGLGIGSTTLMFAIVNAVLVEGPPFPQSDRLFTLWNRIPEEPRVSFSPKEFAAWQKQTQVFDGLAFATGTGFTISGRGEPELVIGRMVPPVFFSVLRSQPQLGRTFAESEANEHVVVLSDTLWRKKFAARPDVLGESVTLNGQPYTVVGVLPQNFEFDGADAALFAPVSLANPMFAQHPDAHFLRVIGRLKPGVTRHQLDAEVNLLGTRVDDPDDRSRRYFALSLSELTTGDLRTPLLVLLAAVSFLLLIACANVANLTLARSSARQSEIAIRAAIGASRPRLMAQLLTESTLLAVIGGGAGIAIAVWGLDLLRGFGQSKVPELLRAHVNTPVLGFAIAVSALAAIFFGLGPAFTGSRTSFQAALKGTSRTSTGNGLVRQTLVFAEIAIAAVLLICSALMMRSFAALTRVDPGFRPANVVTVNLSLGKDRYPDAPQMVALYRKSLEQLRQLPGVDALGVVTHLPFGGNSWGNGFDVEGYTPPANSNDSAQIRPVSPGYFAALGIALKQGRDFTERDRENTPGVAIVNEVFAKRFWPNESPIGKRVRYFRDWLTVIGVCGNIKHARLDAESDMEIYASYPQVDGEILKFVGRDLNFVVRSTSPGAVSAELRNAIRAIDPNAVVKINTMDALIRESTAQPRFRTWLIAIFSGFALTLACLGIYGVIAYLVTQRYKEIGIRMALGATRANILQLVLGRTFRLATLGIAAGLVAAFFLSRFLASMLFGVTIHDPLTFVTVPLGLIAVALLAGFVPARRATRVDPVTSLRYE
ncbi:MAG: ADOP family duplicated permease [Chthoniobacterales bacterium]